MNPLALIAAGMANPWAVFALFLAIAGALGGTFWKGLTVGRDREIAKQDAKEVRAAKAAAEAHAITAADIAGVGLISAQKTAKDRIVTRTIIEKVDRYAQANPDLVLSGAFRVLYDEAVIGAEIPIAPGTSVAPVTTADVAKNAAFNYAACRYDQGRLEALQKIVELLNKP